MADWGASGSDNGYSAAVGAFISSTTTYCTVLPTSATQYGYGAWTVLSSSTPFPAEAILFAPQDNLAGDYAVDIGIGAEGGERTLVQRLFLKCSTGTNVGAAPALLPISVPEGSRLVARAAGTTGGTYPTVALTLMAGGWGMPRGFGKCRTYNVVGATAAEATDFSQITASAEMIAGTSAYGGYVTLASSLDYPSQAILLAPMPDAPGSTESIRKFYFDLAVGAAPTTVVYRLATTMNSAGDRFLQGFIGPFPLSLPAGTVIKGRAMAVASTGNIGIALYVFS